MNHTKPDIGICSRLFILFAFLGLTRVSVSARSPETPTLTKAEGLNADVIVLDITMPRPDGIDASRQLRRSQRPARLVFLTVHEDADYARVALDAGGLGYVVKARLASDLLPAIRAALADQSFISPTVRLEEARLTSPDPPAKPTPTHGKQ